MLLCNLFVTWCWIVSYLIGSYSSVSANNQLAFMNAGGLRPAVNLLRARDDKTKEMAVTLVSFVTTNHGMPI